MRHVNRVFTNPLLFDAAESRLPVFARPIFRAAALPGHVLLDE
jgi:hypothetical protein